MQPEHKKKVLRRLKIAQGQLQGIIKMVEDEKYCIDIITQSNAVKAALSSVQQLMLENHLATHVLHQINQGNENKAIKEILKVYKLAQKNT